MGKIIVVSNNKGGTGKTTFAFHLAVVSGEFKGFKTLLVDMDLDQADALRYALGISKEEQKELSLNKIYKTKYKNVYVVATNEVVENKETWRKDYDVIIIDTDPQCKEFAEAIQFADGVLIPFDGRMSIEDAIDVVTELRKNKKRAIGIINKSASLTIGRGCYLEAKKIGIELSPLILTKRVAFERAYQKRIPVWDENPNVEFDGICEDLLEALLR
jgi:cellulose biosynthesis protein BcsQ